MNGIVPRLIVPLVLVLAVLAPERAEAQRMYFGGGIGPAVRIDDAPTQFRLELEIGAYFDSRPTGFFLAFSPAQSYGGHFGIWTFPLRLGGMFDVFRNRDFTFQLGPTGTVGFALTHHFDAEHLRAWFHTSFAFMLRALFLQEQLAVFLRPVAFEFLIGPDDRYYWRNEAIRYVITVGVQYHF